MGELVHWVRPSLGATVAFLAVVTLVVVAIAVGLARALPRRRAVAWGGLALWVGLTALPSASGVVRAIDGPGPLIAFFAISNLTALALALSPVGARLAELPVGALVAFQAFRLPLELVLHRWHAEGAIPVQMTFEGHNLDIVTGVLALVLGLWATRAPLPRAAAWLFNLVGSALLLAVMFIALTSSPVPARLYDGPPLLLGYFFPYAWIVPLCVAPALAGHVVLFRALVAPMKRR